MSGVLRNRTAVRSNPARPLRVVIVAAPDVQPLDVCGPFEVFSVARRKLWEAGHDLCPGYDVELLSISSDPVLKGESGLSVIADGYYQALEGIVDTILLAGGMSPWEPSAEFVEWLRFWASRIRRLCSVCTGAFALAAAGLLEGRRATTHWYFCQRLAAAYPGVKVDPEPIFIRDGNIYTSAGVTTGMDLALALVEEDFGADVALRIARALVLFLRRPGGQSQFSVALNLKPTPRSLLGDLHLWIIDHLNESLTVETLAAHVAMSPRNFSRIFAQEHRITPAKFVEQLRLETARRRLEDSSDGVKRIAEETGFGSSESMRRVFLRHLRVSPTDYRSRFQGHFPHLNTTVKELKKN